MKNTIDTFLKNWEYSARAFYTENVQYFIESRNNRIKADELGNEELVEKLYNEYEAFTKNLPKQQLELISALAYGWKNLDVVLKKEVESKKKKLIATVEKKAGKILDTTNLYIGKDGNINGIVTGEIKTVNVETILAGGYNIQCLHYRILVK